MGNRDLTQAAFGAWALAAMQTSGLALVRRGPKAVDESSTSPMGLSALFPDQWLEVRWPPPIAAGSEATVGRVVELLWHGIGVRLAWSHLAARSFSDALVADPSGRPALPSLVGVGPSVIEQLVREAAEDAMPEDEPLVVASHLIRELLPEWLEHARPIDPWFGRRALVLMGLVHWPIRGQRPNASDPDLVDRVLSMAAGDAPLRPMTVSLPCTTNVAVEPPQDAEVELDGRELFLRTTAGRLRIAGYASAAEARMAARALGISLDLGMHERSAGLAFLEEAAEQPQRFVAAGVAEADLEAVRRLVAELDGERSPERAHRLGTFVCELWARLERSGSGPP